MNKLPPLKSTGETDSPKIKKVKSALPPLTSQIRQPKEPAKQQFFATTSPNSIMVKFGHISFGIRKNGSKFDSHTENITVSSDNQYVRLILSIIRKKVNELTDSKTFADNIVIVLQPEAAETLDSNRITDDSNVALTADLKKWLNANYPHIKWDSIEALTMKFGDLYNMCECYDKIAYELNTIGGTATSIRIYLNKFTKEETVPA